MSPLVARGALRGVAAVLVTVAVILYAFAGNQRSERGNSGLTAGPMKTFVHVTAQELDSPQDLRAAARYDLVVVRGRGRQNIISDLRRLDPSLDVYVYEQGAALNDSEVRAARSKDPAWVTQDPGGRAIHPRAVPSVALGDLTKPGFRSWRARDIARQARGADGVFIDTLGAYFPDGFYTGRPDDGGAPVSDAAWRDGSEALVRAVRRSSGKPVIVNGFGLSTGTAYYRASAAANRLIAAADGVQIEGFTRFGDTPVDSFYGLERWRRDVDFLNLLGRRGKTVLAYTKVRPAGGRQRLETLRDYSLGTFLIGYTGARSFFGFNEGSSPVPSITSEPGWAKRLGAAVDGPSQGDELVRRFSRGQVSVDPRAHTASHRGRDARR